MKIRPVLGLVALTIPVLLTGVLTGACEVVPDNAVGPEATLRDDAGAPGNDDAAAHPPSAESGDAGVRNEDGSRAGTRDDDAATRDGGGAATTGDAGTSGGFCATFPSVPSVKPVAGNTGVPSSVTLVPSGSLTITTRNAVIDGRDITGSVTVAADGVTIRNSKIHSAGDANAVAVHVNGGIKGTQILYSEIYTTNGGYIGLLGDDTTVCGSYLHGWENAMTIGGGSMIQANYIDRLSSGQPGAHFDGIEVYGGGAPSRLFGNNIRMTDASGNLLSETGAINLTAWAGNIDDVTMTGNWLGGGSYTLYVDEQGGYQATNVKIEKNRFYRGTAAYGTHMIRDSGSVTSWSGNVFDDTGSAIAK